MRLHLDFETRSEADLETVGATAYAMHPSTEVLCLGYTFDDEPVHVLTREQVRLPNGHGNFRPPLADAARTEACIFVAQNAPFEDAIWEHVMVKKYGYPPMRDPKRWDCTMARALMVGLPAGMADMAKVLGLPFQKDLEGRRAMLLLSKPKADGTWNEDPALYEKMYAYNKIDVEVERAADKVLPMMGAHERAIWEHTLVLNRRGVQVDLELAKQASAMAKILTEGLNAQLRKLTGGFIDKATQIARLKAWLFAQGLSEYAPKPAIPSADPDDDDEQAGLDKAAMLALLEREDISPVVRKVIAIRQQVGKSSTSKYVKTIESAGPDGRVRGVIQYHGAHTGRDAGRLIQPQNYPKGFMDPAPQAAAIAAIMSGDAELVDILYGERAMDMLSDTLRGTIIAGPGKHLVSADFNSIELCVEMWLAGDEATLALLRKGGKPYVEMAQAIYNDPAIRKDTHPKQYDLGKRAVLGCGYQMGAPKFKVTCKIQANLDIEDELAERAVKVYREKYPLVVALWKEVNAAAIAAVKNPGQAYASCGGKVLWVMSRDRRFLVAKLPSGRFLWYWKPVVRMEWMTYCKDENCAHVKTGRAYDCPHRQQREGMNYWGKHPKTKQWVLLKTYGGLLVENVTQAVARDLMMHGAMSCEAAGFDQVLRVHDELLAEVESTRVVGLGKATLERFLKIMCELPAWAAGCPVAAEGWIGPRYRK